MHCQGPMTIVKLEETLNVGGHSIHPSHTRPNMTSSDIVKTASKVFGLYFMVQAITSLRDLFYYLIGIFTSTSERGNEGLFMILASQIYMGAFNIGS
jgi:hypothetical protein